MLKEGFVEDPGNSEKLAQALRVASTASGSDGQDVSLADYVARMKEGQTAIYYVTAERTRRRANSPHLEVFRQKGIEVVLSDRIDEWVVSALTEFDGKPLRSVAKGALDLGALADAEEKSRSRSGGDDLKPLVERIGQGARRTGEGSAHHPSADRIAGVPGRRRGRGVGQPRAPAEDGRAEGAGRRARSWRSTRSHALMRRIETEPDARIGDWAQLLYDQALLAEGGQLPDPAGFVRRINALMFAPAPGAA